MSNFETRQRSWFTDLADLDGRASRLFSTIDQLIEDCAGLSSPYFSGWAQAASPQFAEMLTPLEPARQRSGNRISNDDLDQTPVTPT